MPPPSPLVLYRVGQWLAQSLWQEDSDGSGSHRDCSTNRERQGEARRGRTQQSGSPAASEFCLCPAETALPMGSRNTLVRPLGLSGALTLPASVLPLFAFPAGPNACTDLG